MSNAVALALAGLTLSFLSSVVPAGFAGEPAAWHQQAMVPGGAGGPPPEAGRPAGQTQLQPLPQPRPVPDIERVGLERSDCLTRCPAYTVVFSQDGSFRYMGQANVERLGEHTGSVPRGSLAQVLRYVAAIDFLTLADTYDDGSLDNPAAYTLVEWGGVTKIVRNLGNSAPATVWALEQLLDDLLELATWE